MIARSTRIALEAVAAVAAVAVVAAGVAAWRLAQGPVRIDFLTPYIERGLAGPASPTTVEIGATVLAWEGWPETVALRARNVLVRERDGPLLARVPSVRLQVSFAALLSGTLAPRRIEVSGARLSLVREADGSFGFGRALPPPARPAPEAEAEAPAAASASAAAGSDEGELTRVAPEVLGQLMAAPDPARPLSYLQHLEVRDLRLTLHDRRLSASWLAPHAAVELHRRSGGIAGGAELQVVLGEATATVEAALDYQAGPGRLDVAASFRGLSPAALARAVPALWPAAGVSVPLAGSLTASLDAEGRIAQIGFDVAAAGGRIDLSGLLPEALTVREAGLRGRFDRAKGTLTVDHAALALGTAEAPGPRLSGHVAARGLGGDVDAEVHLETEAVPADDFARYWPLGLGGGAREWVLANIRTGTADSAELTAELGLPGGDPAAIELKSLGGSIAYSGADVHYLRPLPPVTAVDGTAAFDAGSFRLDVARGALGSTHLHGADIDITGLDGEDHRIAIDFETEGPLREALALLDRPRLDLVAPLGLRPEAAAGHARVRTRLGFPLVGGLTLDDVAVEAEARLTQVAVADLVLGKDARGGRFDLQVDRRRMRVRGPVELAGVPLTLDWRESFDRADGVRSLIRAEIPRLGADGRRAFGLETAPYLEGPVSAALVATSGPGAAGRVNAALNLRSARLALPLLNWTKPAGEPGTLRLALALDGERPAGLRSFALRAGGERVLALEADGAAELARDGGGIVRAELDNFRLGGTRLNRVEAERRADGGWALTLAGAALDAQPVLRGALDSRAAAIAEAPEASVAQDEPPPPLGLRLDGIGRLRLGPGRHLEQVTLAGERGPEGWWRRLRLEARLPNALMHARPSAAVSVPAEERDLRLTYAPGPDGRRDLALEADDAGALLRAVDAVDTVEGGRLTVEGRSTGADPASPIEAKVKIDDFKVVDAPVLARLLTVASFTGIRDLLRGEGIGFDKLVGEVRLAGRRAETDLVRAYGPALGLTAKGEVDLQADRTDLEGTIVPAYSVNSVLGKIPVLGSLLVGGKGEGVFAVTYAVRGPVDDPAITVNPLAALAPGFLRGVFGLVDGADAGAGQTPQALPMQPQR